MRLEAMAVHLPDVAGHPNRAPFQGVLTRLDEPSTKPPSGARGHRVILTRAAALAGLPSLLGMAVDYVPSWDGHDARRKCGIITEANVEGSRLLVAGYLFAKDFPDVERQMRQSAAGSMGMSWELADAHVEDMRQEVWTLTRATFTGAAILLREKAAYRDTSFELAASRCRSFAAHATSHLREGLASRTTDRRKETPWTHQRAKEWTR
ncbi:MAG: hypothetical protein WB622_07695 [Acidobacteriaceae bacterium]|jgi:hypothetical protein